MKNMIVEKIEFWLDYSKATTLPDLEKQKEFREKLLAIARDFAKQYSVTLEEPPEEDDMDDPANNNDLTDLSLSDEETDEWEYQIPWGPSPMLEPD